MSEKKQNPIKSIAKKIMPEETRKAIRQYPSQVKGQLKRLTLQPALEIATPRKVMTMLYSEFPLSPEHIIQAYQQGMFIDEGEDEETVSWENPKQRYLIPIDTYNLSQEISRNIAQRNLEIRVNTNFEAVVKASAESGEKWIIDPVIENYLILNKMGITHSIEAYQNDELVGGMMGFSLASFFASECAFEHIPGVSKTVFAYVALALQSADYLLHDCQESNDFNLEHGAVMIDRESFMNNLTHALLRPNTFPDTERINQIMDSSLED